MKSKSPTRRRRRIAAPMRGLPGAVPSVPPVFPGSARPALVRRRATQALTSPTGRAPGRLRPGGPPNPETALGTRPRSRRARPRRPTLI
jgi:hypothetical protein